MTPNEHIDLRTIRHLMRCPECKASLNTSSWRCSVCQREFHRNETEPLVFLEQHEMPKIDTSPRSLENTLKNSLKRWPRLYRFMTHLIAPVHYSGVTVRKFLSRFPNDAVLLNVGSGTTREHPRVINVDIFPFPHVDILALGHRLPFQDASLDAVCSEQVLEHVRKPHEIIAEMIRVTKPGGWIYISVPFIYPYHPSPDDYTRWSVEGISDLLAPCQVKESGVTMGPTSALLVVFAMWLATVFSFGQPTVRVILNHVFMLVLSPLKFLDVICARIPGAKDSAACIYVIAQK